MLCSLTLARSVSLIGDNVWHMLYTRPKKTRSSWLTICRAFSHRIKHIIHDLRCHRNKQSAALFCSCSVAVHNSVTLHYSLAIPFHFSSEKYRAPKHKNKNLNRSEDALALHVLHDTFMYEKKTRRSEEKNESQLI